MSQKTQILHISDLHLSSKTKQDQSSKLESLLDRVKEDRVRGFSPEIIAITGDLAFSGKEEEYNQHVKPFLNDLLSAVGCERRSLFIVPGNHDVDLDAYRDSDAPTYDTVEKLNRELERREYREELMKGQKAYFDFANEYCAHLKDLEQRLVPFVCRYQTKCGKQLDILGLNSAWLYRKKSEQDRKDEKKFELAIGEHQVSIAAKEKRSNKPSDLTLFMFHHPMDWLWTKDVKRCRRFFHHSVLLSGHTHKTRTYGKKDEDIDYLSLQAGATYQDVAAPGTQFHYITLDWINSEVRVDYRKWDSEKNKWHAHCKLGKDGVMTFIMPGYQPWRPLGSASITSTTCSGPELTFGIKIYKESQCDEFHDLIKKKMRMGRRIVLIGTGLNVLQNDAFAREIMKNVRDNRENKSLEIFLANPFSPDIEGRLIEEELGSYRPPVGKLGLLSRLRTFLDLWEKVSSPDKISLRLFNHYPTFALIIVDDNYFVYPYGYAKLGNFSPVIQFTKTEPANESMIRFLDAQYDMVRKSAQNLKDTMDLHDKKTVNIEGMPAIALYFIPQENTGFYQFGSEILGYDVRKKVNKESVWQSLVGGARWFGFHLTICDVLYFQTASECERACKEIEFVLKDFKQFEIENMEVRSQFPDKSSISIVPVDRTGNLEAIHHEMVQRVYRRAVGSDYTFSRAEMKRDKNDDSDPRNLLVMNRYRAPYILSKFAPHFTLLTEVPEDKMIQISKDLQEQFIKGWHSKSVCVSKIAIMTRQNLSASWEIEKEISLQ
ncbi:MAG: metallophosphoesterase [Desulfobacteraceae bacterium]|nr:metallophosphoesterase [Desulfobacteraceae bacterium]